MFLASNLKEKLKIGMEASELMKLADCTFPYKMPPPNTRVLEAQKIRPDFTHEELKEMTKEDYLHKFTLSRLWKKWERKYNINFSFGNRKFVGSKLVNPEVKTCREYIKNLLDKDIFEMKKPSWDMSIRSDEIKKNYKKNIFEVNHNFNSYFVQPLKNKIIDEGIDVRDSNNSGDLYYWNLSSRYEPRATKILFNKNSIKSKSNTRRYWNLNGNDIGYKTPQQKFIEGYNKILKIKQEKAILRESIYRDISVQNPCLNSDKLNQLVDIELEKYYKNDPSLFSLDEKKISKENQWKDTELISKMKLVEENLSPKNNDRFAKTFSKLFYKNKSDVLQEVVTNKKEIEEEEDKIRRENEELLEKQKHNEILIEKANYKNKRKINPLHISKYPISKDVYNSLKSLNESQKDNLESKTQQLSNTLYLKALKKVLLKKEKQKKIKKSYSTIYNKQFIQVDYFHPGVFREFEFKVTDEKGLIIKNKKEIFSAWSCCNNRDPYSKGCQKNIIDRHRFIDNEYKY